MAGKGGGAWKVAYADFVTAMMAFFLVMWICGQDQAVKRSVSYYFVDPFGSSRAAASKKPTKSGAVMDQSDSGSVPGQESVAIGRGRNPYLERGQPSPSTKLISDWVNGDKKVNEYWREQAEKQRTLAQKDHEPGDKSPATLDQATQQLAQQLREEVTRGIPASGGIYRELFFESLATVNWRELAEDLLGR